MEEVELASFHLVELLGTMPRPNTSAQGNTPFSLSSFDFLLSWPHDGSVPRLPPSPSRSMRIKFFFRMIILYIQIGWLFSLLSCYVKLGQHTLPSLAFPHPMIEYLNTWHSSFMTLKARSTSFLATCCAVLNNFLF